ncbi:MAG: hypothetical protein AAB512_04300 [Patescibacteria group bacterium]
MKLTYKIGTGIATAALFASAFAPAIMADNTITENGAGSTNTISVTNTCSATVVQANDSDISVKVKQTANTGGNEANKNTGGDVSILTGDVSQTASVSIAGSTNTAVAPSCCGCEQVTPAADISLNGADTTNAVVTNTVKLTSATQANKTKVKARIKQKAKTGKNKANENTNGVVDVTTGGVTGVVGVAVSAPSNTL